MRYSSTPSRKNTLKALPRNAVSPLTTVKTLVIMNDGFDILKTGWTLSLIVHDMLFMFLTDIWLPPRSRNAFNGYSTIRIVDFPINHEILFSLFPEISSFYDQFSPKLLQPSYWQTTSTDIVLKQQARAFFEVAPKPKPEIIYVDTGITIDQGAINTILFMGLIPFVVVYFLK